MMIWCAAANVTLAHVPEPADVVTLDTPATDAAVLRVLDHRCAECHGPNVDAPDGDFGYVLDLKRLIDEQLIVPGDPDASELYLTIEYGEMPTEDATHGKVTPEEQTLLKRWIAEGAIIRAAMLSTDNTPNQPASPAPTDEQPATESELPPLLVMLGRLHPATVHFPIALLITALFAELLGLCCCRSAMRSVVSFTMWLAVPASVAALAFGLLLYESGTYAGRRAELLEEHEWMGMSVVFFAAVAAVALAIAAWKDSVIMRWVFRVMLVTAVVFVVITGHYGGLISNGLNWYDI